MIYLSYTYHKLYHNGCCDYFSESLCLILQERQTLHCLHAREFTHKSRSAHFGIHIQHFDFAFEFSILHWLRLSAAFSGRDPRFKAKGRKRKEFRCCWVDLVSSGLPGYEPKTRLQAMMQRRRATQQELDQGMKEMKDAQIRMESETREAGELPIEDKRIDERDEQQVALRQKGEQEVEVLKSVSQT